MNGDQCSKEEEGINIFSYTLDIVRIAHVTVQDFDLLIAVNIFQLAAIIEGVVLGQGLDFVASPNQKFGQMRADKFISGSYKDTFFHFKEIF